MKQRFVNWETFTWALGIILILFTISFGLVASANIKADKAYKDVFEMKTDIGIIKTNIIWIREELE